MTRRLALTLALPLALAACSRGGASLPPAPATAADAVIGVKTVRPRADAGAVVRATGEVRARNEASLAAEVSGRILRYRADVGDRVKRGDVLVELDDATARIGVLQARAALAAAEAAHDNAEATLRRTQELARGDAASQAALDQVTIGERQAAAARDQAAAALASAELHLAKHTIRAPFDGVVTARARSAGEFVANMPPTALLALVDLGSLEVRAAVPESVVDLLAPGAALEATVSPSGKPFQARIRAVGAAVEPGTRTVDVRAVPVGATAGLRPGALVEVRLSAKGLEREGVFLPARVVQRDDGKPYVWAVVSDHLERRDVRVEPLDPGTVRVLAGLSEADVVVAEAGGPLAPGARVRVLQ